MDRVGPYFGHQRPAVPDRGGRLGVALVFPGPERLALSTLGWQAVYRELASRPEFSVERFFAPETRGAGGPVRSADSSRRLDEFPLIAFSLNFEEELLDAAAMLAGSGIALRAAERGGRPLVLAGGPLCFLNPAPILPMADMVFVGEAEAGLAEVLAGLKTHLEAGGDPAAANAEAGKHPSVLFAGRKTPAVRAVAPDTCSPAASVFVSPKAQFRDMFLLEVNRGCPYGCRFCAAGFVYRPVRRAAMAELKAEVEAADPAKVGLVGTSLTDWPDLLPFLKWLKERGTKFSLSSVRADGLSDALMEFLRVSGTRTLTLALEAPSKRLRLAANKRLKEEDLLSAVTRAAALAFNHLKLYLIAGWPGETDADYAELAGMVGRIQDARRAGQGKKSRGLDLVTLSVSPLVPKPWTPFQWAPMADPARLERDISLVRDAVKGVKGFKVTAESVFSARLQGLIARGDESVFSLVEAALAEGGWRKGLKRWPGEPAAVLDRERDEDEPFPWEIVDSGVSRGYLLEHWRRYKAGEPGSPCPEIDCAACARCGMQRLAPGVRGTRK